MLPPGRHRTRKLVGGLLMGEAIGYLQEFSSVKAESSGINALDLDLGPGQHEPVKMNEANARIKSNGTPKW